MAQKRSQAESEQPAKVYQLDAVDVKVDRALEMLTTLVTNTSDLVSEARLTHVREEIEKETDDKIKESEKKIHLEYRPFKKGAIWLASIIVGLVVTQFVISLFKN